MELSLSEGKTSNVENLGLWKGKGGGLSHRAPPTQLMAIMEGFLELMIAEYLWGRIFQAQELSLSSGFREQRSL
jgi:hypothetical protein